MTTTDVRDALDRDAADRPLATDAILSNRAVLRLTAALFILPNALFAAVLSWPAALLVVAGCALGFATLWRTPVAGVLAAPLDARALSLCLALAAALCVIGGEGHFFYAQTDWLWRDAVLNDLVKNGFSVLYRLDDRTYLLRAPLGMYLTPALVGRFLGLHAAHLALIAQNALALGAVLYLVAQIANVRRTPLVLLILVFSGADVLPNLVAALEETIRTGTFPALGVSEWWTNYWLKSPIQFSSHLTQIAWVPNHMLPGWWFATLSLLYVRREVDLAALGVTFAALLMWSPLAMMGALPILALFALGLKLRDLVAPRLLIGAAGAAMLLPIVIYLTADAGAVPRTFLLATPGFALVYIAFLIVEIPQAGVIACAWDKVAPADRRLLILSIAVLVLIPLYGVGEANDTVMRASIAPLFILAFSFARVAVLTPRDNGPFATIIGVMTLLTFATPMIVLKEALQTPYAISDCNLLTTARKTAPQTLATNYFARSGKIPSWLMTLGGAPLTVEDRKCWPDHPLLPIATK